MLCKCYAAGKWWLVNWEKDYSASWADVWLTKHVVENYRFVMLPEDVTLCWWDGKMCAQYACKIRGCRKWKEGCEVCWSFGEKMTLCKWIEMMARWCDEPCVEGRWNEMGEVKWVLNWRKPKDWVRWKMCESANEDWWCLLALAWWKKF